MISCSALEVKFGVNEEQLEDLKIQNSELMSRLRAGEKELEDLKTENSVQLSVMDSRLRDGLNKTAVDVEFRLGFTETQLTQLETLAAELMSRLRAGEKELEDLKTENSVQLSVMDSRLRDGLNKTADVEFRLGFTETQLTQLETLAAELMSRLRAGEKELEDLKTENSVQLSVMDSRLRDGLNKTADVEFRLGFTETQLTQLETLAAELMSRLRAGEKELEDLKTENSVQLSVMDSRLRDGLNKTADVEFRLGFTETQLTQLETLAAELMSRLRAGEKELEDLKTENSVQLSVMDSRLRDGLNKTADVEFRLGFTETQLTQLETLAAELMSRLRAGEKELEDLKTENSVQLSVMDSRLRDGLNKTADVEFRLGFTETQLTQLETLAAALKVKLRVNEEQLEDLKIQNSVQLSSMGYRLKDGLNRTTDVEFRLRSTETHLEQLEISTAALGVKLEINKEQLQDLKTQNSGREVMLSAMAVGLNRTEEQLVDLRTQSSGSAALLVTLSDRLTAAQTDTEELQVRLKTSEAAVNQLNSKNGDELKVGFSAGLTDSGSIGPFDEETTLIFSKTITNIGEGYNQSAGVFTAPVRGVYFFSFTAADYLKGYMGLHLYRNSQPIIFSLDLNDHGGYASTASMVALQLEQGDQVRLSLPASYRLYDDSRNFSLFSGFLLFQL
ncbi:nuclear mitotic apparatus protein 1-like [Cololabis saira]|uniref:nuclear mitotic apparatus protein 1-like n=1 Tax=Cololabis saira TaxID=129043 RepID=UPI002AD29E92|nr:nuclear mitotic apparatus protein 1-like [Cololabis saira]